MTQTMIEQLDAIEYSHLLAYGEPMCNVVQSYYKEECDQDWISTLDSTTYPGLTFGYFQEL